MLCLAEDKFLNQLFSVEDKEEQSVKKKSPLKEPKENKEMGEKLGSQDDSKPQKKREKGSKLAEGLNLSIEGLLDILDEEEKIDILYYAKKYIHERKILDTRKN